MERKKEHLIAYLPYGLKGTDTQYPQLKFELIGWRHNDNKPYWKYIGEKAQVASRNSCNPLLHPLSDLTKEIDIDFSDEKFIPFEVLNRLITPHNKFSEIGLHSQAENLTLRYNSMQKLFEWHFDVFGLIESGLAIDINTL